MLRRLSLSFAIALPMLLGSIGVSALPAQAQITEGLQSVGQEIGLSNQDPRIIVARIINIALGLIGMILVSIIVYAGFTWMTAGGDGAKVDKAKAMIRNAIIGVIIILSSWAITTYVLNALLGATTDGGGISDGSGGQFGGGLGGGSGSSAFQVASISPKGDVKIRNVEVKVLFNKPLDDKTISGITVKAADGNPVAGTMKVELNKVLFAPVTDCPAPNQDRKCFDGDAEFTITVPGSVKALTGQTVVCSQFAPCTATFKTGNVVDTQPPLASVSFPYNGMSVSVNSIQTVQGFASDDQGVALADFYEGEETFGSDAPQETQQFFDPKADWDTIGASLGEHYLSLKAYDIDSNTVKSSNVTVVVRAEHCFDGKQNNGETDVDCGGDPQSADFCGACQGGSCTKNQDCSGGFCQANKCVVQPVISAITPQNGKIGTFVSLKGANFGAAPGEVVFLGNVSDPVDDKVAQAPAECTATGGTWTNTLAVVGVPIGANSGPIRLKNVGSGLSDQTDNDTGPKIPDFSVNNTEYPGLCALKPVSGVFGTEVEAQGVGFGSTSAKLGFGKLELTNVLQWTASAVRFKVPVSNAGPQAVTVKTSAGESNPVDFLVQDKSLGEGPVIASLSPEKGPKLEYVTISGKNFGYTTGLVLFSDPVKQLEAIGDTNFPPICANGFWGDSNVIIKVPEYFKNKEATSNGVYQVKVKRADGATSNAANFEITSGTPKPGICALAPSVGPEKTTVIIGGEHLGLEKPTVYFSAASNKTVQAEVGDAFTSGNATTIVPKGAVTGAMTLQVQGQTSNPVQFQVLNCNQQPGVCGPSDKFQCCPSGACMDSKKSCGAVSLTSQYAWQTSTGLIPVAPRVIEECRPDLAPAPVPSPSPWIGRAGGDQAPIDSAIQMRFSRRLDPTTVTISNFQLFKCTGTGTDPCAQTVGVPYPSVFLIAANPTQDVVKLGKNFNLEQKTTYLVNVSAKVKASGIDGAKMEERPDCGKTKDGSAIGYCFRFRTRDSAEPSQVNEVSVIPNPYVMSEEGEQKTYLSNPVNSDDKCINVECLDKKWSWYTGASESEEDTRAAISKNPAPNDQTCVQVATALKETGDVPVDVSAKLLQSQPVVGKAKLFVKFQPPKVVSYGPNCDLACSNALIWANFSSALNEASVKMLGNVVLHKCLNEQCNEADFGPQIPLKQVSLVAPLGDAVMRRVEIEPQTALAPGAFYRVILRGGPGLVTGIKGKNGVPMEGLNHPKGFAWKFRVKQEPDSFCVADRVEVAPQEKFESRVGASQLFNATPYGKPDACSASGQALVQTTQAAWSVADAKVATLWQNGKVNTGGPLPLGCSGKCLLAGSPISVKEAAAVCGNGKIETTNSKYCVGGKTPAGDACTVMAAGAKAGEECEPGIGALNGLCDSDSCLIIPNPGSSSCGNGAVEFTKGEECDFGPTCFGGTQPGEGIPGIADYTSCLLPAQKDACVKAGGECKIREFRGCSATCKHLGSNPGNSTCGNGDALGDGKDCDDNNGTDGDGCSSQCLHEGSSSKAILYAVCGNKMLEAGEACEATGTDAQGNPIFPNGCDKKTCLHTGVLSCVPGEKLNCCGNGKATDAGKDCDDGNSVSGDGCSAACLFEGSNAYYTDVNGKPAPSFCGDGGQLGKGEQCEASKPGDAYIDRAQLATIVGIAKPDVNGLMQTDVKASVELKEGKAIYGLQCGFTQESSCTTPGDGLDDNGCCRPRPVVNKAYPPTGATEVCRNVRISAKFNTAMKSGTVINNFEVSEAADAAQKCAAGTTEVLVLKTYDAGFWGTMKKWWDSLVMWVTGEPVYAAKWCKGSVTGQLIAAGAGDSDLYSLTLDQALKPKTKYRVRFLGDSNFADNNDVAKRVGVKTVDGVVQKLETVDTGLLTWTFTTSDKVCAVNQISIEDITQPENHPFLFVNPDNKPETRGFEAVSQSIQNGVLVPLSPVKDYDWKWDFWTSSKEKEGIVTIVPNTDTGVGKISSVSDVQAKSGTKNGTAILTARMKVENDLINVPSMKDQVVEGVAPVTVMICQNPWPSLQTAPFRDVANSPSKQDISNLSVFGGADPFAQPMNFLTSYCRDAGEGESLVDDIPDLNVTMIPASALDVTKGILRQYLFTYPDEFAALKQDGIGVRVFKNPMHLSPEEWYFAQGFNGSPKPVQIDGYPALVDGNTTYVAMSNRPSNVAGDGKIYSNIFVLSFNPDASKTTQDIAKQLVENLNFNVNILSQGNVCFDSTPGVNKYYTVAGVNNGQPVGCTTDLDCLQFGNPSVSCESTKWKLIRDTQRIRDFQNMSKALEGAKGGVEGTYPQLKTGTFLPGQSNSKWTSWQQELGALIGNAPTDPINEFLACGRCEKDIGIPCSSNAQCSGGQACIGGRVDMGGNWKSDANVDPASCWDKVTSNFSCPRIGNLPTGVSRLYLYRAMNAGQQYELGAEFEIPPKNVNAWWDTPLPDADYRCFTNDASRGRICSGANPQGDKSCRTCTDPNNCFKCAKSGVECSPGDATACKSVVGDSCAEVPEIPGVCRQTGGKYKYNDICKNVLYGQTGICGDGVVQQGEACEIGQTKQVQSTCAAGQAKIQSCVSCQGFQDDPKNPACFALVQCGNGKIDRQCSFSVSGAPTDLTCEKDTDCSFNGSKGSCVAKEVCDEGKLNGGYAHCNLSCNGYEKFCGNGKIEPGEVCDLGSKNGEWGGACALDCKGPGPMCGDGEVNSSEQCDGNTLTETGTLCSAGTKQGETCSTDADCPNGSGGNAKCGGTPTSQSCVGVTVTDANGAVRQTQHVRSCNTPSQANKCQFKDWTSCIAIGSCGDGIKDAGEGCDDGNKTDSDACTNSCKQNICGDGHVNAGVEECDNGSASNGTATCNAEYSSSCLSCSSSCKLLSNQGGFCGDGSKNGAEQCDGNAAVKVSGATKGLCPAGTPAFLCDAIYPTRCMNQPCTQTTENVSCTSLGYDFATNPIDPKMTGPTNAPAGAELPSTQVVSCPALTGMKWYEYQMFKECGGLTCKQTMQQQGGASIPFFNWVSTAMPKTSGDFWKCVAEKGPKYGISVTADATLAAKPSCGLSCAFSGCAKCSDAAGTGVIKGYIYDALYQQVVPNARVTLTSKGVKVDEIYTDENGHFSFGILNTAPACNQYRLVVDMYQDNPCTTKIDNLQDLPAEQQHPPGFNCRAPLNAPFTYATLDEGVLGGYFPYKSETFGLSTFDQVFNATKDEEAHVNIFPRPQQGNVYTSVLWKGGANPSFFQLHTILPEAYAFTVPSDVPGKAYASFSEDPEAMSVEGRSKLCIYATRPEGSSVCTRDVNARAQGYTNIAALPYTRLICIHHPGDKTSGWDDGVDENKKVFSINGCPVEGTTSCKKACDAAGVKSAQECLNSCGLGEINIAKLNGVTGSVCNPKPEWESCYGISGPPISSFVNYKQFAVNGKEPIRFVWQGQGTVESSLPANKGRVYLATSDDLIEISSVAAGSGALHLADLNPVTGLFTVINQAKGANMHAQGEACYDWAHQCSGLQGEIDAIIANDPPVPAGLDVDKYHYYSW